MKVLFWAAAWAFVGALFLGTFGSLLLPEVTCSGHWPQIHAESTAHLLEQLDQALSMYRTDHGHNPEFEPGLSALWGERSLRGGTYFLPRRLAENRIVDSWGRPIVYRRGSARGFLLYSVGPNGIDEGGVGDDIRN